MQHGKGKQGLGASSYLTDAKASYIPEISLGLLILLQTQCKLPGGVPHVLRIYARSFKPKCFSTMFTHKNGFPGAILFLVLRAEGSQGLRQVACGNGWHRPISHVWQSRVEQIAAARTTCGWLAAGVVAT